MSNLARIQLVGPCTLLAAIGAADAAAYALAQNPSSSLLWYLNLDVFSLFRTSRAALDLGGIPFAQTLLIAVPIALIGLVGMGRRKNLCLAISSNLTLVYAAFVAYSWLTSGRLGQVKSASLALIAPPSNAASTVLVVLALTSLASCVTSHLFYFLALRPRAT